MSSQKFRVGGGYTTFVFDNQPIMYAEVLDDRAPKPVGSPEPIHPLDQAHPIEIAFPTAHSTGTLTVTIREQWSHDVWEDLPGYSGANNIIEVFKRNLQRGNITCVKTITQPDGSKRSIHYHNCVVTEIDESESVKVGTMSFAKSLTIMYTHRTKS